MSAGYSPAVTLAIGCGQRSYVNGTASADTLTFSSSVFGTAVDLDAGTDTLNLSNTGNNVTVKNVENVNGGSSFHNITIANTSGTTTVTGGGAADTITASAGVDQIRFTAATDSVGGATDQIVNFDASQDNFVFDHAIMASLNYIGTANFTGAVGDIHFVDFLAGSSQLQVDVNGSGVLDAGDMMIDLHNLNGTLGASNFPLV